MNIDSKKALQRFKSSNYNHLMLDESRKSWVFNSPGPTEAVCYNKTLGDFPQSPARKFSTCSKLSKGSKLKQRSSLNIDSIKENKIIYKQSPKASQSQNNLKSPSFTAEKGILSEIDGVSHLVFSPSLHKSRSATSFLANDHTEKEEYEELDLSNSKDTTKRTSDLQLMLMDLSMSVKSSTSSTTARNSFNSDTYLFNGINQANANTVPKRSSDMFPLLRSKSSGPRAKNASLRDKLKVMSIVVDASPVLDSEINSAPNDKTFIDTDYVHNDIIYDVILESKELPSGSSITLKNKSTLQKEPDNFINNTQYITSKSKIFIKRINIANEILYTERTYIKGLRLLENVFYKPLIAVVKSTTDPQYLKPKSDTKNYSDDEILKKPIINGIFSNLMDIKNINEELLKLLENRLGVEEEKNELKWDPKVDTIGDIFCQIAPFFKMYSIYVKNFNHALELINHQMHANIRFSQFLKSEKVTNECKGLSFEAYLILPVQRIPRYKLLLQDLLNSTPLDHADYKSLVKALNLVEHVALFVNEMIKQHEMTVTMLDIQKKLNGFDESILKPGRKLVKIATVWKICRKNHQKRVFLLFSDMLIYAKPGILDETMTFHRKLNLINTRIVDVEDTITIKNSFQIISSSKSFAVYCDSIEEKISWIKDLQTTIDEFISAKKTLKTEDKQKNNSEYNAPVWIPDDSVSKCFICFEEFGVFKRRHHCRICGKVVCHPCSTQSFYVPSNNAFCNYNLVRACDQCFKIKKTSQDKPDENIMRIKLKEELKNRLNSNVLGSPRRILELRHKNKDLVNSPITENDLSPNINSWGKFGRLKSIATSVSSTVENTDRCQLCLLEFNVFIWRYECSKCNKIICKQCLSKRPIEDSQANLSSISSLTLNNKSNNVNTRYSLYINYDVEHKICDPCYHDIEPDNVIVDSEGGGWAVRYPEVEAKVACGTQQNQIC